MITQVEETQCRNIDEAQALANFLWNERERHLEDAQHCKIDLSTLLHKWGVKPIKIRRFVKP